jgi:hypothetical protein
MPKNVVESLKELSRIKLERDQKTREFIYTQTDSLITWLVGFAFTSLALILSNMLSIKTNLRGTAKPVIFCVFFTIFLGLVFRYVSYLMMIWQRDVDNYFMGAYGELEMNPFEPDENISNASYDYIIKRLKDDFAEIMPFPKPLNEIEQQMELPKLINHYKSLYDHSKKQLNVGINRFAEIQHTAYKIDKEKTLKLFQQKGMSPKIGFDLVRWTKIRGWLYTLCILSFLTAIFIVSIYLLFM